MRFLTGRLREYSRVSTNCDFMFISINENRKFKFLNFQFLVFVVDLGKKAQYFPLLNCHFNGILFQILCMLFYLTVSFLLIHFLCL